MAWFDLHFLKSENLTPSHAVLLNFSSVHYPRQGNADPQLFMLQVQQSIDLTMITFAPVWSFAVFMKLRC